MTGNPARRGAATIFREAVPPPQLLTLRSGLDSLRAVVDTMSARDSVTYRLVQETRREVAEQRDILLSTRATSGSTTQELFQQMERLQGRLDEVLGRFQQINQRNQAELSAANANQLYDQAAQDLTQGRYPLALGGFWRAVSWPPCFSPHRLLPAAGPQGRSSGTGRPRRRARRNGPRTATAA